MAKKEKPETVQAEVAEDSVVYFVANAGMLDSETLEYLNDKPYITLNGSFRKFKNFITMAFSNQRAFDLAQDTFWRLDKEQAAKYVIGSDALPIELSLMQDYQTAYLVGYDDIRLQQIKAAYEKAENISTKIRVFKLES